MLYLQFISQPTNTKEVNSEPVYSLWTYKSSILE